MRSASRSACFISSINSWRSNSASLCTPQIVEQPVMQPILVDRGQLVLERFVEKLDDPRIALHARLPFGAPKADAMRRPRERQVRRRSRRSERRCVRGALFCDQIVLRVDQAAAALRFAAEAGDKRDRQVAAP